MPRVHAAKRTTFALAAVVLWLAGCDAAPELTMHSGVMVSSPEADYEAASRADGSQVPGIDARFIRHATARIEVPSLDQAVRASRERATSLGGIVAESELASHSGVRSASLLIRVPSDFLDDLLEELESLGDVHSISVSSVDVSREYFDAETRLAVKEQTVRRLTELVQRSGSIEDLVTVERELSRATTELESLKGQIRYYDLKVAQSDVRVHLTESGRGFTAAALRPVTRAFADAIAVLARSAAAVVYVMVFLIPWLLVGAVLWSVGRRAARARRRRQYQTAEGHTA